MLYDTAALGLPPALLPALDRRRADGAANLAAPRSAARTHSSAADHAPPMPVRLGRRVHVRGRRPRPPGRAPPAAAATMRARRADPLLRIRVIALNVASGRPAPFGRLAADAAALHGDSVRWPALCVRADRRWRSSASEPAAEPAPEPRMPPDPVLADRRPARRQIGSRRSRHGLHADRPRWSLGWAAALRRRKTLASTGTPDGALRLHPEDGRRRRRHRRAVEAKRRSPRTTASAYAAAAPRRGAALAEGGRAPHREYALRAHRTRRTGNWPRPTRSSRRRLSPCL